MSEAAATRAVRARISGRVQGVWYRAWTVEQATARGLAGWVRNREDGSVEAVFAGGGPRWTRWSRPAGGGRARRRSPT